MNFIVKNIYKLEANADLSPGKGIIGRDKQPIKAIHCIKKPNAEIVMRMMNGQVCTFPPGAFVCGAIYQYEIRQVNEVGADCFMGLTD
jgi:hypothetical protein